MVCCIFVSVKELVFDTYSVALENVGLVERYMLYTDAPGTEFHESETWFVFVVAVFDIGGTAVGDGFTSR